jgi:competence ComEA-like helix-hairpin-helix protein
MKIKSFFMFFSSIIICSSCLPIRTHDLSVPVTTPVEASININTASRDELETLPGIGETLANRIIEHRERYGKFRRVEHLLLIKGLSDKKFRRLRVLVKAE